MRGLLFAGIMTIGVCQVKPQPPVSFPSEFLDIKIDNNYFSINGIYTFRNNTDNPMNTNILFPVAVKTALIDSIRVINMRNLRRVVYKKHEQGISFNLQMSPCDTVEVNIFYRQQLAGKNLYILRTTESWGAPLEKAVYSLTTDKNLKITSFSLKPDTVNTGNGKKVYLWNKHNFSPQADFEVIIDK
jgi:hypothetical protein